MSESEWIGGFRPSDYRVRRVLADLWSETRGDWRFVTERLAHAFREAKELHSAERRIVAEALYGLVRRVRTIDWLLAAVGVEAPEPGRAVAPSRALLDWFVYRVCFENWPLDLAMAERPEIDWPKVLRTLASLERIGDPVKRFALQQSVPDWLAARLIAELGAEAEACMTALNERAPMTLRANRLKGTRAELAEKLKAEKVDTEPTRWSQDGLVALTRVNAFGLKAFKAGLFEVQDEASQLVAALVLPPPHGLVVDACAGAGGKTLALGAAMGGRGRLIAMDVDAKKLDELGRRARRAGLSNHRWIPVANEDQPFPLEVAPLLGKADRVLVDAPCSGVGALRRNPEARWRLGEDFINALPARQLAIAKRAATLVKPGGRLIYATCTIFRAENEEVLAELVKAMPEFEPVSPKEILGRAHVEGLLSPSGDALRTYPHRHGMDGFFGAVLRRRA
jgi:16S rRNA (cytosine967-C5)-methyltransferase